MNDLFQPVRDFEQRMADFTGFKYGVAVESCSAALFLCCLYEDVKNGPVVEIPKFTYPSAPAAVIHAGGTVEFLNYNWQDSGYYRFGGTNVIDAAKTIWNRMGRTFDKDDLVCLSFHAKKALPIGRGGMVLTNNNAAAEYLRIMRHDGRHDGVPLQEDHLEMVGWNFLMTPEQASRGLTLMGNLKDENICPPENYPDLSRFDIWNK